MSVLTVHCRRLQTLAAGAVLALSTASTPSLADCAGLSVIFGNLTGATSIQVDLADPAAFWLTYFHEDPSINQGDVPAAAVAFDLGPYGGTPGTAMVFGDWGGGLGLRGCPLSLDRTLNGLLDDDGVHEVFAFGDSTDLTIIVTGSFQNSFDFDRTGSYPTSSTTPLPTWSLRLSILSAVDTADGVRVELSWSPPVINRDPESEAVAAGLVTSQWILEERQTLSGVLVRALEDQDGDLRDSHAIVLLPITPGYREYSRLSVRVQLSTSSPTGSAPALTGPPTQPIPVPLEFSEQDLDRDGYSPAAGDCDDSRASVYPGAPELCDGLDNDCNQRVDELDADGDGYLACVDDCNDADPAAHPSARELCNRRDDDCDGPVDEGCRRRRWR